ncbi:MAG: diadenylate cyclase [Acidimicrobiales bacterium]
MDAPDQRRDARLRRLVDELRDDVGRAFDLADATGRLVVEEIDHARRPHVHERRVASSGVLVAPSTDPDGWSAGTSLEILRGPIRPEDLDGIRRFADGLSSWIIRRPDGPEEWTVFDRPAGSERDLVVLADVLGATVVQRHPTGTVRVADAEGVLRWHGLTWHHEPPVSAWIDDARACPAHGDVDVVHALLEFAVHDLGSNGIGALLIYRPDDEPGPAVEARLPPPPPLGIRRPTGLAPLRHALAQVDGAAVFDASGTLRQLGVRLVPTATAEAEVDGLGGMRHTAARRYSFDDPQATVIVVSEDGPVTVLRAGRLLGSSGG